VSTAPSKKAAVPIEEATLADLCHDPNNARKHTPRNIGVIADSLQELGAARSIVVDEENVVLAGNGVVEAAGEVGITKVRIVDAEGDEIIAVRRKGLTPEQKIDLALRDNRAAELAEWDGERLKVLDKTVNLSHLFTEAEKLKVFGDDESGTGAIEKVEIKRAQEVVWMLLAIPVESWPKVQGEVERLQLHSEVNTMVARPAKVGEAKK
jgi:hypothetical protein